MLFKADVIVWDLALAKRSLDSGNVMIGDDCFHRRLKQHLTLVQGVAFSSGSDYLATLGGQDDNALVVWHVNLQLILIKCKKNILNPMKNNLEIDF